MIYDYLVSPVRTFMVYPEMVKLLQEAFRFIHI